MSITPREVLASYLESVGGSGLYFNTAEELMCLGLDLKEFEQAEKELISSGELRISSHPECLTFICQPRLMPRD